MSSRADQLLDFYRKHRIADQIDFYTQRRDLFDRAAGQAMVGSAILLAFATAVGALAGTTVGPASLWTVLATALPAVSTALVAYTALYAFGQQSKVYADAARAVRVAARSQPGAAPPDAEAEAAEMVKRVEAAFRQEQAQWGQLTSQLEMPDNTRT